MLKQLGDLGLGISNKEYQKLLEENRKDPNKKIVINEKLELKSAKDKKAIDKIYSHLSKTTSEEYKEVRRNLDQNFLERLVGSEKLKELMKSKLVGDAKKIKELYDIVEEAKYNSFKEVTGIEPKRAELVLREGGAISAEQGSYDRRGNIVEANTKPFLSFLRTRAKNNEEILNTFIHELTHQEQGVLAENVYSDNIKDIKSEAKLFLINDELYIDHEKGDIKKYKAQPLEKEAFETGDTLAKKYIKNK